MTKLFLSLSLVTAALAAPAFSEHFDINDTFAKHLKTSRDFTVKVAEAMPASDYSFKLTPAQMSFGEQMVHLASGLDYFVSPITGEKIKESKPSPDNKEQVIAFVKAQYDHAIDAVGKLSPEQLSKTYKSEEGSMTGLDMLVGLLDHSTHHRASAEMYLRAKGIKPPEYQF
jgi:uncharacterized damage-inducible protein DinB